MGGKVGKFCRAVVPGLAQITDLFSKAPAIPAPMPEVPGKTIDQLRAEAQQELGIDSVNHYNFAFCGGSGVGKSTMINVVQGVKDTEAGAAPIGVTETTQAIAKYPVEGYPHVILWDVPGAGTEAHKAETYFMDKKLYAFDFLLMITGNRLTQIDIALARNSVEAKVPVAFVRSKTDVDLMNKAEEAGHGEVELVKADYHREISGYIRSELPEGLQNQPLFLVSAKVFRFPKYAEYKLDEELLFDWVLHVAERRH